MAKSKSSKKKVVVSKSTSTGTDIKKVKVTKNKVKKRSASSVTKELSFGKKNFQWVMIGIGLVALGMILMLGGGMPSPDVWDESLIYSFRRITLAPIVIIAGLIVSAIAIFKD